MKLSLLAHLDGWKERRKTWLMGEAGKAGIGDWALGG